MLLYVAFCTIMAILRQNSGLCPDFKGSLCAQYHRQHCTLQAFGKFCSTVYMQNSDDKHPTRPGFEPSTSGFRATTGPNELSYKIRGKCINYGEVIIYQHTPYIIKLGITFARNNVGPLFFTYANAFL